MDKNTEEAMQHARALAAVYLARHIGGEASASFIDEILTGQADDHPSVRPFVARAKASDKGPFEVKLLLAGARAKFLEKTQSALSDEAYAADHAAVWASIHARLETFTWTGDEI